ncbi:MAG: hypothetical protein M9934_11660 [Thermomicrobiales bacterium]|nr:hypothetical protein [Thermomicrobiales bacterium]
MKQRAVEAGRAAYGDTWTIDGWAIAPGRIELIGNHTDYNGGPVLAGAIDRVIVIGSGRIQKATEIGLVATDLGGNPQFCQPYTLSDWRADPNEHGPIVYVKGIIAALIARRIPFRSGVGLAVAGDIPPGFGMSSSAALCVATILALTIDEIDPYELVAIAREAEHRAGAMVGAMDQSASIGGGVIRFDGRDNTFTRIAPSLGDHVFAVADSGVSRSLRTSAYGARVRETTEAREIIAAAYGRDLANLAAVEPYWDDILPTLDQHLSPELLARVRHIITETRRVNDAADAVDNSDWIRFGELMNESGASSAGDYDISDPIVEALVAHLKSQSGVLGARMMGGGNGGPALVLLRSDAVDDIRASLDTFYDRHPVSDSENAFQVCVFGPGAHRETFYRQYGMC